MSRPEMKFVSVSSIATIDVIPLKEERGIAAIRSSQVLSQLSTVRNADELICRVRNETGSFPAAVAAMPNYLYVLLLI
jgi:hypothetical protein